MSHTCSARGYKHDSVTLIQQRFGLEDRAVPYRCNLSDLVISTSVTKRAGFFSPVSLRPAIFKTYVEESATVLDPRQTLTY